MKVIPETRRASFYSEFQTIKSRFFKESVESRHLIVQNFLRKISTSCWKVFWRTMLL